MRKLTLTAMALALTVAAGAAQAGSPHYLPYNHIQGLGDLHMPKVYVYPHYVLVNPKLDIDNAVEFGQINDGDMKALQGLLTKGPKDVTGTAAAVGNTAAVDVRGGVFVEGNQKNFGNTKAGLGALVLGADKVDLTAAAIGNSTSVETDGDAVVDMNQVNMAYSMRAGLVAGIFSHGYDLGSVETTAAGVGNSLSVEFGKNDDALVSARQGNWANASAVNITAIGGKYKKATATAAAIGNSINISN
ncbi:MAG: hypothetical protein ACR2Q4_04250 [Geminicoccaceae bacterium]